MTPSNQGLKNLKTIVAAASEIGISPAGMRWIRFNANKGSAAQSGGRVGNGFEAAFVKIGRRVFVDMDAFYRCVAEQNALPLPKGGK